MQWGDLSFRDHPISHYLSGRDSVAEISSGFLGLVKQFLNTETKTEQSLWDSRDNKLLYLINKFKNTQANEDFLELQEEYYER